MKVLITGATGLVGKAITKVLHTKGIAVNYLTTSKDKIVSTENYNGFYWNPTDGEIDIACFEEVSAIINLAGASIANKWTTAYKKKVLSSRIDSIQTLHEGLKKVDASQIKSFVSASAIGIYPSSLYTYYDETETAVDDSFLGEVVEEWEKKIDTLKVFDFNVAKIRIGIVLSTEGGALPKMASPVKNYVGAAFGNGKQWQSWIHINDLANIFVYVLEKRLKGIFNAVAPNPVTNSKMTKELAKILKKPLVLPNVPKPIMELILGEMSYLLFASHRVSSKRIEKKGYNFEFSNICCAIEDLYTSKQNVEVCKTKTASLNKEVA
ncbi:TIGR01777 family oxidoreductase [Flagellimonas sp. HMM57]|uniref:TIGR01777 family oxidoreductase n=1 Tax=unclassified Flagellimonas TaxID=2644544 RepID=UPI0013D36843|nr:MULTISPECIES: TIGR01777 family oxidoreductase [unclassified Flagellimonas]UII75118.1 TIGR01777 family oxidoreductase [Flagellimonas sp. HMM57]